MGENPLVVQNRQKMLLKKKRKKIEDRRYIILKMCLFIFIFWLDSKVFLMDLVNSLYIYIGFVKL